MKSDAGYDPFADFMPVTQLVGIPLGLIAHPSFEANTVAELIALAKKTPGGINYSSGGPGSPQHVGMELFVRATGIQMTHVPHRGATEAVTAIVSGSVPVGITGMSAVFPLLADKRVKLIAVTTAQRLPQLPDAPAISETVSGFGFMYCDFTRGGREMRTASATEGDPTMTATPRRSIRHGRAREAASAPAVSAAPVQPVTAEPLKPAASAAEQPALRSTVSE